MGGEESLKDTTAPCTNGKAHVVPADAFRDTSPRASTD